MFLRVPLRTLQDARLVHGWCTAPEILQTAAAELRLADCSRS